MWDGDGKPTIWAYRLNFFRNLIKEEPDVRLSLEHGVAMFDFVDGRPKEDLEVWHCDKCGRIQIFQYDKNHEYWKYYEPKTEANIGESALINDKEWEDYIVFNDKEFEEFESKTDMWFLSSVINEYEYKKIARVSNDEKEIHYYNYEINKVIRYELIDQRINRGNYELKDIDYHIYKYVTVYYLDDVLGKYSYLSGDLDIKLFDKVLVPRGNQEVMARVVDIKESLRYDAPYPHEKLKEVIKIINENKEM